MNAKQLATNVWTLQKSPQLKAMLVLLVEQLGAGGVIVDHEIATVEHGIWLLHPTDPEVRAYLYVHGQQDGRAGVHLEYPSTQWPPPAMEFAENLAPRQLADILAAHFDLTHINPLPSYCSY